MLSVGMCRILAAAFFVVGVCAHADDRELKDSGYDESRHLDKDSWHKKWESEHHKREPGSAVLCPFLQKVVPKAKRWVKHAHGFVNAAHQGDDTLLSRFFAEDAKLTVHNAAPHQKTVGHHEEELLVVSGRESISKHLSKIMKGLLEVRVRGLYPDFVRKEALLTLQVFSKCPHSGELFASEWALDVPKMEKHEVHAMTLIKREWQALGTQAPAVGNCLADRLSIALGQAVGKRDCTSLKGVLGDNVQVDFADAFFHHTVDDKFTQTREVTSLTGVQNVVDFCNQTFKHQEKFMPLEYLALDRTYEVGCDATAILTGSLAMKVIFGPGVKDWHGAVRVTSEAGDIKSLKAFPLEITGLAEKWAWKYGERHAGTRLQRAVTFTVKAGSRHPYALAGFFGLLAFALLGACTCCFMRLGYICVKKRSSTRELATPLNEITPQETVATDA